jgi:hypothetical protein
MAVLDFNDKELKRAWRNNLAASSVENNKTNAHRLLLFYAVECGLKAMILKKENKSRTDLLPQDKQLKKYSHDINKLLQELNLSSRYHLKDTKMKQFKNSDTPRPVSVGDFNQMWRYGGNSDNTIFNDNIEKQLHDIIKLIEQEINS